MKKLLALTIACLMLTMSFVACATDGDNGADTTPADGETTTPVAGETTTPAASETTTPAPELSYKSALELLQQLMDAYNATATDETKLYVGGGNTSNFETVNQEGPAKFVPLEDADYDASLGYPVADVSKIDDAASMFNLMNANIFTAYAVHFTNSADVDGMINTIKENILARQWVCGAPEKLVMIKMPGDYVVVIWGAVEFGGIVDPVAQSFAATFDGAQTVVEHKFAF